MNVENFYKLFSEFKIQWFVKIANFGQNFVICTTFPQILFIFTDICEFFVTEAIFLVESFNAELMER